MSKIPNISIIIPTYNESSLIEDSLNNIIDQILIFNLSSEIIVVDDCSTDNTKSICENYLDKIKLLSTPFNSGGAGAPRNIGMQNASGNYLIFYDVGDVIDLKMVEGIIKKMEINNINLSISKHIDIDFKGNFTEPLKSIYLQKEYYTNIYKLPALINNPFCWGKIYNKNWLEINNIKFGNEYCGEDKVFTWHCYLEADRIYVHPSIFYGHRIFDYHTNRMLKRNIHLATSLKTIDQKVRPLFIKKGLLNLYEKRLLIRDINGIILSNESINILKNNGDYELVLDFLSTWFKTLSYTSSKVNQIFPDQNSSIFKLLKFSTENDNRSHDSNPNYILDSSGWLSLGKSFDSSKKRSDVGNKSNGKPFLISFYLPQFHPVPENDEWWGKGFTEWFNVTKAKPLFDGHYQPHLPTDLGFYDLRVSETREAQAALAKEYGIDAFCYYHYWFNGKRILERPFNEVLSSKKPDFPFLLCWANESWTGIWHGSPNKVLIQQEYSGEEDYINHFNSLLPAFLDDRYVKIENKPVFLIWSPTDIPDSKFFVNLWNKLAQDAGFPGIHFVGAEHWHKPWKNKIFDFNASIPLYMPPRINKVVNGVKYPSVYNYADLIDKFLPINDADGTTYPCITPNWDNTPRSGENGIVFQNSTPDLFKKLFEKTLVWSEKMPVDNKIIFIKAWNEWAEGNCLEPELKYGKQFLEVIRDGVVNFKFYYKSSIENNN